MEENRITQFLRQHWRLMTLLIIVGIFVYMLGQYSFITVTVQNPGAQSSADYNYYLTPDSGGKTTQAASKETSYKKLVRRGSYTVSVVKGETSYFEVIKSGGFFLNKTVKAQLQPEQSRAFVGDNPDACMEFIGGILVSLSCNGEQRTMKVHAPASAQQATYTKIPDASSNVVEGLISTKEGTVALIKPVTPDQGSSPVFITTFNNNGSTTGKGQYLDQVSPGSHHLANHKDGFIVYNDSFSEVYYLASLTAKPEIIETKLPEGKGLANYMVASSGNTIAVAYSNQTKNDTKDVHDPEGISGSTTLMIYEDGAPKEVSVPGVFVDMEVCGTKKLCIAVNHELVIYDISGKGAKKLYSIPDVQDIGSQNGQLLAATSRNVLSLNADKQNGFVAYSFGDYTYCGMETDQAGYTLCLINPLQRKVALRFDPSAINTNSIDKKILALQKSPGVSVVSAYGNFIFIAPNYGQQVYNPSSKLYENDPATVKRMNAQIEQDLANLGLDRKTYTISSF